MAFIMNPSASSPILMPRMGGFSVGGVSIQLNMDPHSLFESALNDAERQLIAKKSGYVWFTWNYSQMTANIIVDIEAQAIRITDLMNTGDHFAFKNRLNRLVQMVERVAEARKMHVVVEGLRDIEDIGYLMTVHSYTVTKRGKAAWNTEDVNQLHILYDRLRNLKWEIEKFTNKHVHEVHCIRTMDGSPVDMVLNPLFDDSPIYDNHVFED